MDKIKNSPPPEGYVKLLDPVTGRIHTVPKSHVGFPGSDLTMEFGGEFERRVREHYGVESSPEDLIKDSGERRSFGTGAVRDGSAETKGAPHLRPVHALNALDRHMQLGARKYESRNWEKGIPLSVFFDSAQRHADKLLAGYEDEDHEAAWLWNVACFIETRHRINAGLLPVELADIPDTFAGKTPGF